MNDEQLSMDDIKKAPTKTPVSKGALLEYRIQRLFFSMGYYAKTGIIIKSSEEVNADVITDLDVYGVYIHKNFTSKRIWADCKSGRAKPLERISWIKGIRSTIKIDDIIFVKSGVRTTTKQFAHRSGIMVLDESILSKLEADFEVNKDDWSGPWNPAIQQNALRELRNMDRGTNGICSRVANFISSNYWYLDEYARVKKSITAIRELGELEQICQNEVNWTIIKWAIFQLIPMFSLATLNICRELYFLNDTEKVRLVRDSLISSEISVSKRTAIVNATYKMATGLIRQQYPTAQFPIFNSSLGLTPPSYFEKYFDLILRITGKPNQYYDVLRLLDYSLQEYALNNTEFIESEVQKRIPNYASAYNGFKTILHFIMEVCNISPTLFNGLLNH